MTAVESGSAALEAIQKQRPDVLLCDLSMPHMDGFELLKEIRRLGGEVGAVPAIACTAFGSKKTWRALRPPVFGRMSLSLWIQRYLS